ncbi:DNA polymerase III subunit chi [Candidatus Rariloculus sp.]|uniref:DNA polymerase III subunit chi n=1 Tax=Candidatus Rariloculus sp. TaxID=3101265 RepID=UPI003D1508A0
MSRVDFYILPTDSDNARLQFACRIADKAMRSGRQTFINAPSERESRQLDKLLWTFSQGSFVPHRIIGPDETEPAREPVVIGRGQEPGGGHWNVMINLATEVPEFFSRYERVVELVDADQGRRKHGRERYRFYRDRGCELNTHRM